MTTPQHTVPPNNGSRNNKCQLTYNTKTRSVKQRSDRTPMTVKNYRLYFKVHYNNPEKRDDYRDGSGFIFYYTPKLRPHDGAMSSTGMYLAIPPGREDYSAFSTMPSGCTARFESNIHITEAHLHMHYLGE